MHLPLGQWGDNYGLACPCPFKVLTFEGRQCSSGYYSRYVHFNMVTCKNTTTQRWSRTP